MTNEEKINLIGRKILILSNDLDKTKSELESLKIQLEALQQQPIVKSTSSTIIPPAVPFAEPLKQAEPEVTNEIPEIKIQETKPPVFQTIPPKFVKPKPAAKFNMEEFVGGKLITIIGIVILVIGIGIGVKYAIDNDLLGPLARIVLAYAAGGILLAIALKLKSKYKAFSSVLLSGGMASLYFTTFAAYSMYQLFPQIAAFAIMVIFTAFTVFAATVYNLEVIGVIGLVGAYAVPMLLSDGSGKIEIMFCYMLIINSGILILSFKKYWQVLNHVSYGFTWLIVAGWFIDKYNYEEHSIMALSFTFLFFLLFYISNMAYKVIKNESFGVLDIIRIVTNSFIFFGLGYYALNNTLYENYLGLFTVANALIHFLFSYIVFKNKMMDRKLFYLLIAMVLSFITIAVPVQLEGHWVTLFWSTEAVLLFYIGRIKSVRFYEWLAFIMVALAVYSLMHYWGGTYSTHPAYYSYDSDAVDNDSRMDAYKNWLPFFNIHLLTSLFVIASLGSIVFIHHKKAISEENGKQFPIYNVTEFVLPILLTIVTYFAFFNEITAYYEYCYQKSMLKVPIKVAYADSSNVTLVYDYMYSRIQSVVQGLYNMFFFCLVSVLAIWRWKNPIIHWVAFGLNMMAVLVFLAATLHQLTSLREDYLLNDQAEYYTNPPMLLYIRYSAFALFGLLLFLTHKLLKQETFRSFSISKIYAGCIVHIFILIVLCNELMNLNHIHSFGTDAAPFSFGNTYKLGFTLIWGVYSFLLIAVGIFRKNKILRISSISLFGLTILKLLLVDTWDLSTGYKVIAYMMLGAILLLVAFLYQKFKVLIFGEEEVVNESHPKNE